MDKNIIDKFDYENEIPNKHENKGGKKEIKPSQIYFEQLLCLVALAVIAFWGSGPRAAVMAGVSVLGAIIMDMAGCSLSKKVYNPKDLSTITAGMCIALLMSSGANYALAFFGSALTIGVKHIFGGKDNYIFNPTAVAFVFLILCYPGKMLLFPKPLEHLPVFGDIDVSLLSGFDSLQNIDTFDVLIGNFAGSMGTVHILVLLVCAVCMLFRRSVSPTVTLSALGANIVFSGVLTDGDGPVRAALTVLVSGYFLFILLFLANDPQTLPKTFLGRIYYGLFFGSAVVVFRVFGKVEGSPAFALLLVNTVSEQSDIMAGHTVEGIKKAAVFVKNRLDSYERIREKAKTVEDAKAHPSISDTQEIIIVQQDYNMPPIDNKIIKINRKKPGFLIIISEKIGRLTEKRQLLKEKKEKEKTDINFMENLRDGVKELGDVFKPKRSEGEREKAGLTSQGDGGLTPLELSLIIDDDDVVEIGVPDSGEEVLIVDDETSKITESLKSGSHREDGG